MSLSTEGLSELFKRDLTRLLDEVKAYKKEENLWKIEGEIANSGGNLCLHLCGNLRHFVAAVLGNSGYIRRRDDEFNLKDVKRSELVDEVKTTRKVVLETLAELTPEQLQETYPINVFGSEMSTEYFLIHLYGHLNYHLGQINYHRRLLDQ
ncbi:DinB family protein [Roseivirga pacifica]|uniref:DinB family protein n=1 Tax=Roseivirga pacifica TaxID=1267423 RepID=UPI002094E66E|nr:DinB family protein [Roseivirga pacifica]